VSRNKNHALRFALYRQVVRAVDSNEYMSGHEIADTVGIPDNEVRRYLSMMRLKFPTLMEEFDEIRFRPGSRIDKFGADAVQPIDEILI
jgi:hypothetical protein